MEWNIVKNKPSSARHQMKEDLDLLCSSEERFREACPSLRIHQFLPGQCTHGHFVRPSNDHHLIRKGQSAYHLHTPRPTGGGIVCHDGMFTFSVLMFRQGDSIHERYKKVHGSIAALLRHEFALEATLHPPGSVPLSSASKHPPQDPCYCMESIAPWDVVVGERKVAGGGQRRWGNRVLYQGVISLNSLSFSSSLPGCSAFGGLDENARSENRDVFSHLWCNPKSLERIHASTYDVGCSSERFTKVIEKKWGLFW